MPEDLRWFHVVLTTYGAWLPGDPRGFRTRKHRLHVEGDYKNPPSPDEFRGLQAHARKSMKRDPVTLDDKFKQIASDAIVESLQKQEIVTACTAVAACHAHLLIVLPNSRTRKIIGNAKRHCWHELNNAGWEQKCWAKRPKFVPVETASHWRNCYRYIIRHVDEGAVVYEWGNGGDSAPDIVPPGAVGGL